MTDAEQALHTACNVVYNWTHFVLLECTYTYFNIYIYIYIIYIYIYIYILSKHRSYCPVFAGRQWQHSCVCRQRNERMDGSRHSFVGRRVQTGGVEYPGRVHRHKPNQTVDYEHHQRCRSVTTYGCSRQENKRTSSSRRGGCVWRHLATGKHVNQAGDAGNVRDTRAS